MADVDRRVRRSGSSPTSRGFTTTSDSRFTARRSWTRQSQNFARRFGSIPTFASRSNRIHFLPSRDYKSNKAAGSIGLPNISFHCDFWSSVSLARRSASRSSRILITLP